MTRPLRTIDAARVPVIGRAPSALDAIRRPAHDLEIVIPAHNEQRRLPRTLEETVAFLGDRDWDAAVTVVDNNSVDGTVDVVRRFATSRVPVRLLGCAVPGKGAAVRRGFLSSSSRYVGFMDADLATPLATLDEAMGALTGGADVAIASRHAPGARFAKEQSRLRQLGGSLFRGAARRIVPDVHDTQCGFKFFAGDVARELAELTTQEGFAFDVEMLSIARARGHRIVELPVEWTDAPGSTFAPLRHGLQTFTDLFVIYQAASTLRR